MFYRHSGKKTIVKEYTLKYDEGGKKVNGLFLQGGGAKGAFQAGVIYGLYERNCEFNILAGTSIGAINSYFIYKNSFEELKKFWLENNFEYYNTNEICRNVIDNQGVIDYLSELEGINETIKGFYVNYVSVRNKKLKEVIADITKLPDDEKLNAIKYSSLLPCRSEKYGSIENIKKQFDSSVMFNEFKEDLETGIYEGYKLDGGIVNNNFLGPFVKNKVDKLFLIVFHKNYQIPDYIKNRYAMDNIVVIEPKRDFKPNDTLRFEKNFANDLFEEGYSISMKV